MLRSAYFCAAISLVMGACAAPPPQLQPADEEELAAVARFSAEVDRCVREKDLDAFAALWTDDIALLNPHQPPVVGKRAVEDAYRAMFAALDYDGHHQPGETHSIGDLIIHQGVVRGTMTPTAGGPPMKLDNKYLWLLRQQGDGSLLAWRVMLNANAPMMPPPTDQGGEQDSIAR